MLTKSKDCNKLQLNWLRQRKNAHVVPACQYSYQIIPLRKKLHTCSLQK